MKGPCLCGDPYCPSCGNPEQQKFYDYLDEFVEEVLSKCSMETLELLKTIIPILESHTNSCIEKGIWIQEQGSMGGYE